MTTAADINGAVIPARSDNDTGNNPHNPVYGVYAAGADGALLTLVGSESRDSGGNSMAPDVDVHPDRAAEQGRPHQRRHAGSSTPASS